MRKVNPSIERHIVTLISAGFKYSTINSQTSVPIPTIKKIRKRNADRITALKSIAFSRQVTEVESLIAKTNTAITERIDKADEDEVVLDQLSCAYRSGEISRSEYYRKKKGLKPLSVRELLRILDMFSRTGIN